MFHRLAVSSLALAGLLVAAGPVAAGQSTGTWKYWNPGALYVAPPAIGHVQAYRGGPGWGHRHPEYQAHRGGYGGYGGYPPPRYGQVYRHRGPAW
jgi:hypothetical protein